MQAHPHIGQEDKEILQLSNPSKKNLDALLTGSGRFSDKIYIGKALHEKHTKA